tara:strand:+ start:590 stop:1066 length:477 start_codon:yes stop_codon:yes gene_type:complete
MEDLKKRLFNNVYVPEYRPEDGDVYRQVDNKISEQDIQREIQQNNRKILEGIERASESNRPLTDAEMEVVKVRYKNLKDKSENIRKKVKLIKDEIEFELNEDPFELVMGGKKPALKKAMKIVFGIKTDTITFEQYQAALDIKTILEKKDIEAIFSGKE